jgi:hypothetical protein
MISNMQYPREMYGKGGLTSLKEARNLLEKYALPGESLAYINDEESKFLKYMGGAGIPVNSSGVPSYFNPKKIFKKITKPVAKVLDKIVPNEIKPILPYIAAFTPFAAGAGLLGTGLSNLTFAQSALLGAGANAISQLSQEGAAERGISPVSLGLAALSGGLSAPGEAVTGIGGAKDFFGSLKPQMVDIDTGLLVNAKPQGFLENIQNIAGNVGQSAAGVLEKGREALEPGGAGVFSKDFGMAALGPTVQGTSDVAYISAMQALEDYDKQQAALGAMGVANTEGRKAAIRRAMGLAGYTEPEIDTTLLKFNFANGGRVGYQMGGASKPPSMPINPDMLAMAIFGKSYDELTYTQKSAINDMLPNKKAEGGIMDLGGLEMDLRAKGGFVPIGGKEKADDVPARLSKNEFVFTADAVRGAGKGDIKKGAKKMYQLMKQYEAIA